MSLQPEGLYCGSGEFLVSTFGMAVAQLVEQSSRNQMVGGDWIPSPCWPHVEVSLDETLIPHSSASASMNWLY